MYNAIQSSASSARVIDYVLNPKEHQQGDRCVYASGIGCSVQTAKQDFADTVAEYGRDDLKVEAYSAVISASQAEFDPQDPEQVYQFHLMSQEAFRRTFPGRQGVIGTQTDGETGLVHSHWIISNVAHENAEMAHVVEGQRVTEQVVAGQPFSSRMSNIFRIRAATNQVLADEQFMASIGYSNERLGEVMKDRGGISGKKFDGLIGEHAYDNAELVRATRTRNQWLVNLKERIADAKSRAVDEEDFKHLITEDGSVRLNVRGKKQPVYSYTFTDEDGVTRTARSGGKRLTLDEGGRKSVLEGIESRRQAALVQAEQMGLGEQIREARGAAAEQILADGANGYDAEVVQRYLDRSLDAHPQGSVQMSQDADGEVVYEWVGTDGGTHRLKAQDLGDEFTWSATSEHVRADVAEHESSALKIQGQRRIDESLARQKAQLEETKARIAEHSAERADEAKQRSEARAAEQTALDLERQEVLDNPPARFAGISEDELARQVDEKVIVREERLMGADFMRSDDLQAIEREHGLSKEEADFLATKWWALSRPETAQERGQVTSEEQLPQELEEPVAEVTEEIVEEPSGPTESELAAEREAAWRKQLASVHTPEVMDVDTSFLDAYRRTQESRDAAQTFEAPVSAPETAQQPEQSEGATQESEQQEVEEQGQRSESGDVLSEVQEHGSPYRSGLRDARSKSAPMQARLQALAEVDEQWHGNLPATSEDRVEFERQVREIGVGSKVLDASEPHMDPQLHDLLQQRAEKMAQGRAAYERRQELTEKIQRLDDAHRKDPFDARDTAAPLRDARSDLRFESGYIDRVKRDQDAGIYTSREHERAEHLRDKTHDRAAEIEPTEAQKRLEQSKGLLSEDRVAGQDRDRDQSMERD